MHVRMGIGLAVLVLVAAGGVRASAQIGTVRSWGRNSSGQLGDGTLTDRWAPVHVAGPAGITALAGGGDHSLALSSDGTVWAWGDNRYGEIGDGTTTDRAVPVQVSGLAGVAAIAGGYAHSLALKSDGTVWAWGSNAQGQLGDGTAGTNRWTPVQVSGLSGVAAIAGGGNHSLALRSDGSAWAWGRNYSGEIGDGTDTDRWTPVQVPDLAGVAAIAAGGGHSLALRSDGTAWAWGYNYFGQLGDVTYTDRRTPVAVSGLAGVIAIAGGFNHCLALKSDGAVWAWGHNGYGGVGDGTTMTRPAPVQVSGLAGMAAVACGAYHSLGLAHEPLGTSMYTIDRSGTITDAVTLRGYLRRTTDSATLAGKTVAFTIDGTSVGSAITEVNGRASRSWTITDGPPVRTIGAEFAGDQSYTGSRASAILVAQKVSTKAYGLDRTARVGEYTVLKGYLLRLDSTYIAGKTLAFEVDGTPVGSAPTNVNGRAQLGYTVPDAQGTGSRPIVVSWAGDGGYRPSSYTTTLTVTKAIPHVWVLSKSIWLGETTNLYAHFRRLVDNQKQAAKPLTFLVDGTAVQTVTTDATGVARYLYQTVESVGNHTIRCEFAGDAWLEPGYGEGTLTIY